MDQEVKELQNREDLSIFGDQSDRILVLGIGNYLMGDEGVGVHIVHRMADMELPSYLEVMDGGTGGFFLMGVFDQYGTVILVDATMDGNEGGAIGLIRPHFASDYPNSLSVHDVGLKDMLEALYLRDRLPDLHLVTISVESIMPMTIEMSEKVESSIPDAIDAILALATELHQKAENQ